LTGKSPLSQAQFEVLRQRPHIIPNRESMRPAVCRVPLRMQRHRGFARPSCAQADLVCSRIYKSTHLGTCQSITTQSLSRRIDIFEGSDRVVESR